MISAGRVGVMQLHVALLTGTLVACSGPSGAESTPPGAAGGGPDERLVELGVPGGDDGLDFVPLVEGAELRLQTFGQGGTHLLVGVRCVGFGKRAFVSASLRNPDNDAIVVEPPPARPQLLFCSRGEDGPCDLVPYLVHATGLTDEPEDMHGLAVRLTARVEDEAGTYSESSRRVVLNTDDL